MSAGQLACVVAIALLVVAARFLRYLTDKVG